LFELVLVLLLEVPVVVLVVVGGEVGSPVAALMAPAEMKRDDIFFIFPYAFPSGGYGAYVMRSRWRESEIIRLNVR
jgi:hypothetical protein